MDMIERVARAMDKCGQDRGHRIPATMVRHLAVAAIEAMREPTHAMRVAALNATFDEKRGDRVYAWDVPIIWQAMIDAALSSHQPKADVAE